MFDTKLANSIQKDYRHAADNHRITKGSKSKTGRGAPIYMVALFGSLMAAALIMF